MRIRLLGGIEARTDGGDPIDLGPPKCRAVLAALALSAGSAVPVTRLVELVWGERPPRTASKTLQSYVTRLRKGLGPESVERVGAAYRLAVDPDSVDVARFQRDLAAGRVEGALAEWSGPPLAGLEAPGLTATVDGLVEQWLGAREAELERLVDGDPAAAVAALTELSARYPFREGLWALLMTALYREGRQAEALAAYRRARHHLVESLGVEPGPGLRRLEAAILAHDDGLVSAPPSAAGPPATPTGTVTFGFSDLDGPSSPSALDRHDEIVARVAADHGGHLFGTDGDSFGVAFDRAGDGARWAVALRRAMTGESWPDGVGVRVGLVTGEAEERADDYFGPTVNLGAALAAAGHGGQILVSEATAALLGPAPGGLDLRPLGSFRLDGFRRDVTIHQLGDGDHPPLRVGGSRRGNLARRTGRLHGRADELDDVAQALAASPIVTVVGPGGIGKTRLALAAARRADAAYPGGTWLVELADIGSSPDVVRAVAEVLDVVAGAGRSLTESIVAHLDPHPTLLVLDNCEHVIDGAAALATAVADRCPGTTVLATSREGLGVAGEQLVVVGPLPVDGPAVELFAERARAVDPGFDLDAERPVVEEICHRLDGVPLAIELAAARTRSLSPSDLVARLDDRLRLLTGGRRRSVERHRTLRATTQWSYDLLTPAEQLLFRRLSVFAGSFDLAAAEAVAADGELAVAEVNGLLGDLVERSMVGVESGAYGRRFRLLETMRQFGAEHLSASGASDRTAARHAAFVAAEVERISALLFSNAEIEGATRLAELWPNVRAAVEWALVVAQPDLVARLLRPIALQQFIRRGFGEIAEWAERLLAITPRQDAEAIGWCLLWAAMHYSMTQERDRLDRLIEEYGDPEHVFTRYAYLVGVEDDAFGALEVGPLAVVEMRRLGQEHYARMFEVFTTAALMLSGDFAAARAGHEALAELFRAEGPPSFLNWTLFLLGSSAAFQGDHVLADRYWEESVVVDVPPRTNSPIETLSSRAAFRRGHHDEAFAILGGYIDELIEVDNMAGVSMVGIEFVNMMVAIGRRVEAAVILGHFDATGLMAVEGPGYKLLVTEAVEVVAGDPEAAAARAETAAEGLDDSGALDYMRRILADLVSW